MTAKPHESSSAPSPARTSSPSSDPAGAPAQATGARPSGGAEKQIAPVFAIFVQGDAWLSRLIRRVTGSRWSHVALGFAKQEGDRNVQRSRFDIPAVYFEALFGEGVVGPKPMWHVMEWAAESKDRAFEVVPIPVGIFGAMRIRMVAETYVGDATYARWQLLAQFAFERWGWPVPRSMAKVQCSEFLARACFTEIDLRRTRSFDSVSPAWLYKRLKELGHV